MSDDETTFRWATVTQLSPLRIRLDGDSSALPLTPDSVVDPLRLAVGTRVWVQFFGRRLIVLAASGGGQPFPEDTGWVTLPIVTANFSAYALDNDPKVRRIGSQVIFQGAVKPTAAAISSVDGAGVYSTNLICTIPEGFRVSASKWSEPVWVCQGSGDDRWSLRVYSSGAAHAHRYGPGTPGTSSWMPFTVSWTVD